MVGLLPLRSTKVMTPFRSDETVISLLTILICPDVGEGRTKEWWAGFRFLFSQMYTSNRGIVIAGLTFITVRWS